MIRLLIFLIRRSFGATLENIAAFFIGPTDSDQKAVISSYIPYEPPDRIRNRWACLSDSQRRDAVAREDFWETLTPLQKDYFSEWRVV